jgi:hypothetical protein
MTIAWLPNAIIDVTLVLSIVGEKEETLRLQHSGIYLWFCGITRAVPQAIRWSR